jgi:hypothetical protein
LDFGEIHDKGHRAAGARHPQKEKRPVNSRFDSVVPAVFAGVMGIAAVTGGPVQARPHAQPATHPGPVATPTQASMPAPTAPRAAAAEESALEVAVTYTGKGNVSARNPISVFLFGSQTIEESDIVGVATIEQNGGAATFKNLPPVVYIALVYDETGKYKGETPIPSGMPTSLHGMASGGAPEGVKSGPAAKITLTFDDSYRMP